MLTCVTAPAVAPAAARLAAEPPTRASTDVQKKVPPASNITSGVAVAATPQPRYCRMVTEDSADQSRVRCEASGQ